MFHKKDRIIHFFKWLKCRQVKLLSAKYSFLIYANEIIYGNNERENWVRKTREEIKTGK